MQHLPNITSDLIRQYQEDLVEKFSPATVKRKSISIGKFLDWAKAEGILDSNLGNLFSAQKPAERTITAKSAGKTRFHNWYNRYQSIPGVLYLNIAVALILTSLVGLGIYNQFFRNAQSPFASPTFTQTRPNRFLSFQGRLTNQYDNPIATPSGIIFNLYDASSSGTLLWNSGTCTVSPDSDGVFSTLLGSGGCGTELTSDIFSQNAGVWLGVKVGNDSEATPRVQIATVAYALNAETLQGFPVDATGSATVNTVVTMNSGGQIVIAEAAPKIKSVSGTFAIEGQALTLTTPTASNGNITISPNGTGQLNLNFSGASPGSGTGMVNATGAQLTSGALYYGSVASNATGYNLLQLQAGSTPANRFTVDAVGNTTASGTINGLAISGGTVSGGSWNGSLISTTFGGTGANNSSAAQWSVPYYSTAGVMGGVLAPGGEGYVLTTHNTSGAPTWTNSASVGTNYWALGSGVIYPSYTTLDLLIGNSATTSAKFAFINVLKNTPTASISANSGSIATYLTGDGTLATTNMRSLTLGGTTTGNILIPNGNLGINNATPGNKFSLNSPTTADTLADALIGTSATTQKGLVIQGLSSQTANLQEWQNSSGTVLGGVDGSGNMGVGITPSSSYKLYVYKLNSANNSSTTGARSSVYLSQTASANFNNAAFSYGLETAAATGITNTYSQVGFSGGANIGAGHAGTFGTVTGINNWNYIYAGAAGSVGAINGIWLNLNSTGANTTAIGTNRGLYISTPTLNGATLSSNYGIYLENQSGASTNNYAIYTNSGLVRFGDNVSILGYATASASLALGNTNAAQGPGNLNASGTITGVSVYQGANQVCDTSGNCTAGTDVWSVANGAYVQKYTTADLLLGATSTASAKFAFINVLKNTPTASISANSGSIATYLTGDGTLATTNMQPLTIGGSTTGSVQLNPKGSTGLFVDGAGNVGIGTTSPAQKLDIRSTSGTWVDIHSGSNLSAGFEFYNDTAGKWAIYNVGSSSDRLSFSDATTIRMTILQGGNVGIGTTAPVATLHVAGAYGGNAAAIIDQTLSGNILTASASGATKFTLSTAGDLTTAGFASASGNLTLAGATARTIQTTGFGNLTIGGSTTGNITLSPSYDIDNGSVAPNVTNKTNLGTSSLLWKAIYGTTIYQGIYQVCDSNGTGCPAAMTNYWGQAAGAIYTLNNTVDVLFGSSATSSAKFAFTGVKVGTPTASISGSTAGMATYLTGNGNLATVNAADLTLGGTTTGRVILTSGATNTVIANGTLTTVAGNLDSSAGTASLFVTPTNLTIGTAAITFALAGGNTAAAINIGNGTGGNTIGIGNGVNTGAQIINIGAGAAGADSTVNILTGVATTGTQTLNLGTGASAKTINIGNGTGATALNLTSGTGAQTFTSSVATGQNLSGAFVFKDTALSSGDMIYATASAITSGNVLKLGRSGTSAFSGNGLLMDFNSYGGGTFTGNYLKFNNNGLTQFQVGSTGVVTLAGAQTIDLTTPATTALTIDSGTTGALNFGTAANAKTISIGNNTGATSILVTAGSGLSRWQTSNGQFQLITGTGDIYLGTDNGQKNIYLGTTTGASTLTLDSGTGVMNIGTTIAKTITLGNATGATSLVFNSGTSGEDHISTVATGTGLAGAFVFSDTALSSGDMVYATVSAITSGNILNLGKGGITAFSGNVINADANNYGGGTFTGNFIKFLRNGSTVFLVDNLGNATIRGVTYTWPSAVAGTTGFVLTSDTSGVLYWAAQAGGTNYWQLNSLVLSPANTSYDLVIGGNATGSAYQVFGAQTAAGDLEKLTSSIIATGNLFEATASAITGGNIIKLGQGGNSAFSGNVIFADIANTGGGGTNFTGNFLKFNSAGTTKFSVNSAGTASISGTVAGNATFIDGNGNISTTNRKDLTLGNSATYNTTGNILLNPSGTGNVGIGTTSPAAMLHLTKSIDNYDTSGTIILENSNSAGSLFTPLIKFKNNDPSYSDHGAGIYGWGTEISIVTTEDNWASSNSINWIGTSSNGVQFNPGTGNINITTDSNSNLIVGTNQLFVNGTSGNVGIGTAVPLATLHVAGAYGGNAAAIINQTLAGDIFTASASGATKMTLANDGTLNLYNASSTISNTSGNITITPNSNLLVIAANASASGNLTLAGAVARTIQTTGFANLTIGGATTGNIVVSALNDVAGGYIAPNVTNVTDLGISSTKLWRNIYATSFYQGASNYAVCDSSGTNCPGVYWGQTLGSLYPLNNTVDVLFGATAGATATSSAHFAFTGISKGTPTASISGTTTGVATFIDGNGNISTTNGANLTLGNSATYNTTGNILLNPSGTGYVGIGTTAPGTTLEVSGSTWNDATGGDLRVTSSNTVGSALTLKATDTGARSYTLVSMGTSGYTGTGSFGIWDNANTAYRMVISAAGNVGIGSSSPTTKLDIAGTASASANLSLRGQATAHLFNILDAGTLNIQRSPGGDAGLTSSMFINAAGRTGIGTTAPGYQLEVVDSQATGSAMIRSTNATQTQNVLSLKVGAAWSSGTTMHFINLIGGGGLIVGKAYQLAATTVTWAGNGIDMAEYFTKDDPNANFVSGTVMCQGPNGVLACTSGNPNNIIGVVSEAPSFVGGVEGPDKSLISVVGQISVLMSPTSPDIAPGDLLTVANGGMATKATTAGFVIGRAQNAWTASSGVSKLKVTIAYIWADPSLAITNTGYLNIAQTPQGTYQLTNTSNAGSVIDKIGAFANVVAANVKAGAITTTDFVAENVKAGAVITSKVATDEFTAFQGTVDSLLVRSGLVAGNIQTKLISPLADGTDITVQIGSTSTPSGQFVVQNANGSAVATIDNSGNATFSGTLYADAIKSKSLDDIKNLLGQVQTDQNLLKDAANWNILTATNSASLKDLAVADLYVTNQAAVNSLSVTNTLAIGSDLVIGSAGNNIDTLSAPLKLQSLAMAPLEIMAGLVTIDTHGNVNIAGDLFVAGVIKTQTGFKIQDSRFNDVASIDASGSAQFGSVSTPQLVIAGADATQSGIIVNGIITTNSTVGQAIIPAGTSEITIKNPKVTDYTLIYVTPTSGTQNNVLFVKSKQIGQFVVGFANPIDTDVSFNWWIVQVQ